MRTGSCLSFWFPVPVAAGATPRAPGGITGMLGIIHRPGGLTQLTYNGKPLYTFRLDQAPGQAHTAGASAAPHRRTRSLPASSAMSKSSYPTACCAMPALSSARRSGPRIARR
jgi:hypothetical protein